MYLAQHLVDSYHVVPNVSHIMDNLEIVLVPFVNPDGYVVGVIIADPVM